MNHNNTILNVQELHSNDLILAENVYVNRSQSSRCLNTLLIGSCGTGKSRNYVKPNILQANGSYVITDVNGELCHDTSKFLKDSGYIVKAFDLREGKCESTYNPFAYIHNDIDITIMSEHIIRRLSNSAECDSFFKRGRDMLLTAFICYLHYCEPVEKQNFRHLIEIINQASLDNNMVDQVILPALQNNKQISARLRNTILNVVPCATGKTKQALIIDLLCTLNCLNDKKYQNLLATESIAKTDIALEEVGTSKQALFIILSNSSTACDNMLASLLYAQFMSTVAYDGASKEPVHLIMDEFFTVGYIPDLMNYATIARSLNITISIIVQSIDQLRSLYPDTWTSILTRSGVIIYMGSSNASDTSFLSEGVFAEFSARDLMILPNDSCILSYPGCSEPIQVHKYRLEDHPNYKYIAE